MGLFVGLCALVFICFVSFCYMFICLSFYLFICFVKLVRFLFVVLFCDGCLYFFVV